MREHIQIVAKMYECQETAMKLFQDEYKNKVQWYIDVLKAIMEKEKIDALKAVLSATKSEEVRSNGMAVMLFMAAAVEMIEGKPKKSLVNKILNK